MNLFRALRIRPFALLWSGQTVSRLGDGLFTVALSWWVLEQTGSAVAMGLVQIFRVVPNLIFLLIGGVLADRLPRLRVMLASDGLRGLLLLVVTVLTAVHALQVWHIYIASLIFGFVDAFFQPAYTAVVPDVVPVDALPSANSLTALSGQFAGIFGTAVGGVIVAIGGSSAAFGLDGLSFFVSAACILPILGSVVLHPKKTDAPTPNAFRELREGLTTVFGTPWLWITILLSAFSNMFVSSAFSIATPFLVKDNLHADSAMFGLILALFSFGSIIGAVGMGSVHKLKHRGLLTYMAWILAPLLIIPVGLTQNVVLVCVMTVFIGIGFASGQLIWTNVLQELVPANLLGRVSSVDQFGSFVLIPFGLGFVGWATGQFGAPLIFSVGGLLAAGVMSLGLLSKAVRTLD
jgi:DHA3 family tetracycline resistance protein-like MFS transporter